MISQAFSLNAYKVLSLFSLSPGSRFGRKEIKEKTLLNNRPLDVTLARLVNSGFLIRERRLYSLNFGNDDAKRLVDVLGKEYRRMREIPFGIYMIVLDMEHAVSAYPGTEAWLFGSYAKLVYREGSDIDMAVLTREKYRKEIQRAASRIEKSYGKNIELHFLEKNGFYSNKKDPLVKDILKNGIRIV